MHQVPGDNATRGGAHGECTGVTTPGTVKWLREWAKRNHFIVFSHKHLMHHRMPPDQHYWADLRRMHTYGDGTKGPYYVVVSPRGYPTEYAALRALARLVKRIREE